MESSRLSSKGQLVVPKSIRSARKWSVGTEMIFIEEPDGVKIRPRYQQPAIMKTSVDQVAGSLRSLYNGPPISLKDMETGGPAGALSAHERSQDR